LDRYQRYLYYYRQKNGRPLNVATRYGRLSAIRIFFRWLARDNHILYNPAVDMKMPRLEKRLPRSVLTVAEMEQVLAQADLGTPFGIRDRAIMEVFYSTGIRRRELVNLMVYDINMAAGTAMVRLGKGNRDRVVPVGERALAWVQKYLDEARSNSAAEPGDGPLFVTQGGRSMHPDKVTALMRGYIRQADLGKGGACHLFRHTAATLMLEGGADIRYIQAMLGHTMLSSTEIYTAVSIKKLKEVHAKTHPARMKRGEDMAKQV
jgi:integrase/recombinase XerD